MGDEVSGRLLDMDAESGSARAVALLAGELLIGFVKLCQGI